MTRSGLRMEHFDGLAVYYRDQADRVFPLRRAAAQAAADDLLTQMVVRRWIDDLEASSASGEFLLSVTLFTVVATKPDT